jgi:hypothetical protein
MDYNCNPSMKGCQEKNEKGKEGRGQHTCESDRRFRLSPFGMLRLARISHTPPSDVPRALVPNAT